MGIELHDPASIMGIQPYKSLTTIPIQKKKKVIDHHDFNIHGDRISQK